MQNNLLFRFSNWQHHVKSSIREDFEILNKMRRNSFSHKAYIPHEEVICAMRAEFWLNFFMHGSNTSYSYVLMRNTFVHVTEAQSIEGGMMLLHPARMNGDERDNHFHLYSSIVPAAYMTAVRQHLQRRTSFAHQRRVRIHDCLFRFVGLPAILRPRVRQHRFCYP